MPHEPNVVEKVLGWIPGYKGYAGKELRRDTDRLFREAVVRDLEPARKRVDEAIGECSRSMAFTHLESLEAIRRRVAALSDRLRTSPGGYSGFFDTATIKEAQLDTIAAHDLTFRELAQRVVAATAALSAPDRDGIRRIGIELDALDAGLRRREDLLKNLG
jgi:hypothetical protein